MRTFILMWFFFLSLTAIHFHLCYFVRANRMFRKTFGPIFIKVGSLNAKQFFALFLPSPIRISFNYYYNRISPNRQNVAQNNNNKYQIIPAFSKSYDEFESGSNHLMSNNDFYCTLAFLLYTLDILLLAVRLNRLIISTLGDHLDINRHNLETTLIPEVSRASLPKWLRKWFESNNNALIQWALNLAGFIRAIQREIESMRTAIITNKKAKQTTFIISKCESKISICQQSTTSSAK